MAAEVNRFARPLRLGGGGLMASSAHSHQLYYDIMQFWTLMILLSCHQNPVESDGSSIQHAFQICKHLTHWNLCK